MKSYTVTKLGESRGVPRIWIEGQRPAGGGFVPYKRFKATRDIERKMLILAIAHNGARVVSSKIKGEREVPVIDINSGELLSVFDGMVAVRVVVQADRIFILPLASLLAAQERVSRMLRKMVEGDPILIGSMSHGGGVLSHALHSGLAEAGIGAQLAFANEIREDLFEQASRHNPTWDQNTVSLAAPMQELAFDEWAMKHLPTVEILEAGLPCSGASVAGRAKRSLAVAEEHPEVGHLVVSFLMVIAKVKPVVVLLENVKQYLTTGSMCILRNQLRDFGYELHETVLQAADWNELEHRDRMCLVAVTHGLAFDLNMIERPISRDRRIAEVLDSAVPADRWSPMLGS